MDLFRNANLLNSESFKHRWTTSLRLISQQLKLNPRIAFSRKDASPRFLFWIPCPRSMARTAVISLPAATADQPPGRLSRELAKSLIGCGPTKHCLVGQQPPRLDSILHNSKRAHDHCAPGDPRSFRIDSTRPCWPFVVGSLQSPTPCSLLPSPKSHILLAPVIFQCLASVALFCCGMTYNLFPLSFGSLPLPWIPHVMAPLQEQLVHSFCLHPKTD
ncbi:hypothetical protein C8R47DRAFT_425819 [Mycena vitilis]|nr:hypothetical protein C8R47DRAFT_425819 [Mycena vitilis]